MAGLSLQGVHKSFGDVEVLKGIDVAIERGEYLVLVGPSGCGKSTLLRCIAGLEDLSAGEVHIGGRRVDGLAPSARDVAMVFQSYALYPHMTVRQNMGFALKVRGETRETIDAAVARVAQLLGLEDHLERLPGQLSGGQRQRVAMGRAIVRRPAIFLFDEPLSNLDASLRHHMRVELKRLHANLSATVVHVTHDQVEALTLADKILVLNEGVVQQLGSPRELFDTPENTFVAQFIGSPQMNLLPATGHGEHTSVDGVEGSLPLGHDGAYTLGMRPTDLCVVGDDQEGLVATVDVLESQGATALVHLLVGEHAVVMEVDEPCIFTPGDTVRLGVSVAHRFDVQTGERL